MSTRKLHPKAKVALALMGLYTAASALCNVFVSVYLYKNSQDITVVFHHYLALYIVTPVVFLFSGWYSARRERLHAYRLGLVLHAAYYALLLGLQERCPDYAVLLGAMLGVTWGVFWAGANTFNFDVTYEGRRESFIGLLQAVNGIFRLLAPLAGGYIIAYAGQGLVGYQLVFGMAVCLYVVCFFLSFAMPSDSKPRPFRLKRALWPGPDQRDWRLMMLAAFSLFGTFSIFGFLLGLLMYLETGKEVSVGNYASVQAIVGVCTALVLGRMVVPENRKRFMFAGVCLLLAAGTVVSLKLSFVTLIAFGLLRSTAGPFFGIPHQSLRLDTIARSVEEPAQRIEYLCAWEVPLAVGRVVMMLALIGLDTDQAASVGESLGLRGPVYTMGGACASGNVALRNAVTEIRYHEQDMMFVCGAPLDMSPVDLQARAILGAITYTG
ncbi:MAG: MFS transporter, partial [bacterium]|nr:MFS transporter [bacterium]